MSLAIVHSRTQDGLQAAPVEVEVHLANGLPNLNIVGLPEAAVKESKDRVRAAIVNSHFDFPTRRITINLAPADLPKEGGRFDLPIALGILAASGQIPADTLNQYEFAAELSLSGEMRPVQGVLPLSLGARDAGHKLVVALEDGAEAALVRRCHVLKARHLLDVCAHLRGEMQLEVEPEAGLTEGLSSYGDLTEVRGQHRAKRVLEIAAAGGHSLLMIGPPGTGKTMLASRLPGILPPMDEGEALEAAILHSVSGRTVSPQEWYRRPFRTPHHTASGVALVGGGSHPRPGEVSLAHHGILFLDELPEFDRKVLEVLREPLESGSITISRAARQAEFPARFQLLAAMNPCPCGYLGDAQGRCRCSRNQVLRYRNRISGPLLDRIDLHIEVPRQTHEILSKSTTQGDDSRTVRERVVSARQRQLQRQNCANHGLSGVAIDTHCELKESDQALMRQAVERLGLSARAFHRVLKVARTIADLDVSPAIERSHLSEALGYRCLDRPLAG